MSKDKKKKKKETSITPVEEIGEPASGEPDLKVNKPTLDDFLMPPDRDGLYRMRDVESADSHDSDDEVISTLDGQVPTLEEEPPKKGDRSED